MIGILIITDAPPPSGAVIGGTLLGVLALVVLVTALFGCLIYYKRRNGRKLNRRYQLLLFMATPSMAFLCHANRDLMFFVVVVVSVSFMKHRVICMTWEIERWRCSSLTYIGITSLTIMCVQG